MQLDRRGPELLFQVLTEREKKASVAIASNESFSGWTKTFTDPRLCAADRGQTDLRRHDHRDRHRPLPSRSHRPPLNRSAGHRQSGVGRSRHSHPPLTKPQAPTSSNSNATISMPTPQSD